jgi:hypothetical protein
MAHEITMGDRTIHCRAPTSLSIRQDIEDVVERGRNPSRILAAALGLCVDDPNLRLKARYQRHAFDVLAYGGDVLDELHVLGVSGADIVIAGGKCLRLLRGLDPNDSAEQEPAAAGVAARADFSEAHEVASTS